MTQEQFDVLVGGLEGFAGKQPGSYKLRVGLLAALGYAYIFLILAGLIGLLSLLVLIMLLSHSFNVYTIKFAILLLIPTFIILRSLWVTFPPPIGLPLTRQEAPRLFALVDELTSKLQAPKFHHILLTNELNAAVMQRPRLGLFGWQQNYLIVGLPLMQALSQSQFRAVLAHEFGHLSGNHSRFAGWIYRVRKTQEQIWQRLHQSGQHGSSVLFDRFFNWYIPFFSAYSFVLARINEYEADRCAAELAGSKNAAEALINIQLKVKLLESEFWPSVEKQVYQQIEPPATIFTNMSAALANSLPLESANRLVEQALKLKTNNSDTHPCLRDRLYALGYLTNKGQELPLPAPVKISAAQELLGDTLNKLNAYFDRTWQQEMSTHWRQKYAYIQEVQKKLEALETKAQTQALSPEEAWERAGWTVEIKGESAAIPLLREVLITEPDRSEASYTLGSILLRQNDPDGINYIEEAMKKDPEYVLEGCDLIYYFLMQQEKVEEAKAYQKRSEAHYNLILLAQQERSNLSEKDKFIHHNLPQATVDRLRQQLSGYPQIKEVYLVRKDLKYFPEKPFYILGVKQQIPWYRLHISDRDGEIMNKLVSEIEYPNLTSVILLNDHNGYNKPFEKKMAKIEKACIYRR
ncbi:M48 family metallopeptidase [Argonema antarcticum]|uniref:M48 family metallopeptidase n=1 Tax=Argonema antarcticum TaxID=2942763 RepID=UPI00201201D6|nr:M48 family metallopeptidase [Argonema antarcticum]MCL1474720.1 M48 family metalloprotease [Argonema antarcticum A004/B2]